MTKTLVQIIKAPLGVVTLLLSDPDNRNAMSEEMSEQFCGEIQKIRNDDHLRVVVVRGSGSAFSGGGHLEMLEAKTKLSGNDNRRLMESFYSNFLSLLSLEIPVIAALNGHAVGAGLCMALACDMRIATRSAKLGLNFVNLGLHPGMGATYFLPRLVGPSRAPESFSTGKIFSADYAEKIGLINQAVDDDNFDTIVNETTSAIAEAGPMAVRELKLSLRMNSALPLQDCLRREAECQARSYSSSEFNKGLSAAKAKKKPQF